MYLKMIIKSLVIITLLFTSEDFCIGSGENTVILEQNDLSMLSCTEIRNITIVMNFELIDYKILRSLYDFIANEDCFYVNMYLNSEDRLVRVHKSDDLTNIKERNDHEFDRYEVAKLIGHLYQEEIMGDDVGMKQSFIFIDYTLRYPLESMFRKRGYARSRTA